MNRDQNLLLYSVDSTTWWEKAMAIGYLSVSAKARIRQRDYTRVKALFEEALGDPDNVYHLEINPQGAPRAKNLTSWSILAVLVVGALAEWKIYSGPVIAEWCATILHRCGLR